MGPRTSEVPNRSVRDLDNGGKILVIDSGKTKRASRGLTYLCSFSPSCCS